MSPYESEKHRPMCLPCGHCLCSECISHDNLKTNEGQVRCPFCRKVYDSTGIRPNFEIEQIFQAGAFTEANVKVAKPAKPVKPVKPTKSNSKSKKRPLSQRASRRTVCMLDLRGNFYRDPNNR